MFPGYQNASGKVVGKLREDDIHSAIVSMGWGPLLEAMDAAEINTPRRVAAFLTTLAFESWCEFSVLQGGSNVAAGTEKGYTGRGSIQLTGMSNYSDAGKYLGVDLVAHPELAQSRDWSAKIATWYWTVARPNSNKAADQLKMGLVNRYVGYPVAGSNDSDRCMVFVRALANLTRAGALETADCSREAVLS